MSLQYHKAGGRRQADPAVILDDVSLSGKVLLNDSFKISLPKCTLIMKIEN